MTHIILFSITVKYSEKKILHFVFEKLPKRWKWKDELLGENKNKNNHEKDKTEQSLFQIILK